jgi:uncharacterized protein (TIGR02145 family)
LKSATGWEYYSSAAVGTDDFGFSALPGGYGYGSNFDYAGDYGYWWSATEYDASNAWNRYMNYYDSNVFRNDINKADLFALRCVQDNAP